MDFYNLSGYADKHPLYRKCYIRSSHIEANAWGKVFWSLPTDMLVALGAHRSVRVFEASENYPGKVKRIGEPVVRYVLGSLWRPGGSQRPVNDPWLEPKVKRLSLTLALGAVRSDRSLVRHLRYFKTYPYFAIDEIPFEVIPGRKP